MANAGLPHYEAWPWRFWTARPPGRRSGTYRPSRLTELFEADGERVKSLSPRCRLDPFRLVEDPPRRGAARRSSRCWPMWSTIHGARDCLFAGEIVNETENRPATHVAERGEGKPDDNRLAAERHQRMRSLVDAIEGGAFGEIDSILHIGIGGSALGPGPGDRCARPRCRPVRSSGAVATSTARRSTRRPGASIPHRRWSSRSARPSPPPKR